MNIKMELKYLLVILTTVFISISAVSIIENTSNESYLSARRRLMEQDLSRMIGASLNLSSDEQFVNDELMQLKKAEFDLAFKSGNFSPSKNFLAVKDDINKSEVYKMIKKMPKGANLHLHEITITSIEWVVSELTYWNDLYMCLTPDHSIEFRFFDKPDTKCAWKLVREERKTMFETVQEFDRFLFSKMSLETDTPKDDYKDLNSVWNEFEKRLMCIIGITNYAPAWEAYLEKGLEQMMLDNILYLEFRGVLPLLYKKDGSTYSAEESYGFYDRVIKRFTKNNSDNFYGARYIYAPYRRVDVSTVWDYVHLALRLDSLYPETVAGFDLVGQEDLGRPLVDFLDPLLYLVGQNSSLKMFFHAGETNWQGMSTDENLIDALLLNTSRIGHGYSILKHPELMRLALEQDIPLEVCPVSNQVLMLVEDLRNHPAAHWISEGYPVVIGSDDPGTWGADPLSHDFYEAFMALGGARADLKLIKGLALNSIRYSSIDQFEREELEDLWRTKWDEFIASRVESFTTTQSPTDDEVIFTAAPSSDIIYYAYEEGGKGANEI